jgi:hypothetical protein
MEALFTGLAQSYRNELMQMILPCLDEDSSIRYLDPPSE